MECSKCLWLSIMNSPYKCSKCVWLSTVTEKLTYQFPEDTDQDLKPNPYIRGKA